MHPFQSNNIWKRAARQRKRAEHPETPEQSRRKQTISTALWLTGGVVILALLLAAIRSGTLPLNAENAAILVIIGLYTLYNAVSLGRICKDTPRKK